MLQLSHNTLPNKGIKIIKGKGEFFWDDKGKRYIDLSSQTLNLLFGQSHTYINNCILRQLRTCTFIDQDFISEQHELAMNNIYPFIPGGLTRFNFRMNDGSSAVECAVKQARRFSGRSKVLTIDGIYLGQNTQVIHLRGWGVKPKDILHGSSEDVVHAPMPYPDYQRPFEECPHENGETVYELIYKHSKNLACVLVDPIMISSGVTSGRNFKAYLKKISLACQELKIPLIFDESQTFGWVPEGTLAKYYNIDVDMIILAKGIAGGMPLSLCAFKPSYDNLNFGDADYTNGGTLASIAGLRAVCDLISSKKEIEHFNRLSSIFSKCLDTFCKENGRKYYVRGVGIINAIEVQVSNNTEENLKLVKYIAKKSLENGVYVRTHFCCLTLKPPRVMKIKSAGEALKILFETIRFCTEKEFDFP